MTADLSPLEVEVADLRRRLVALEDRVRLDANADAFLRSDPRVREGDYCLIDGFPTRVSSISSEGKWTYFNGHHSIEPFRIPPSNDIQRLYTVGEVAEIVAKVRQEASWGLSRNDVEEISEALICAIASHHDHVQESCWKALQERLACLPRRSR